ncbi:hypothetical protein [Agrobacterium sp. lyk4-40-TYG-31]|uniref:hypothetical protein n=1 Tax=Agrobacterium sp. lyk4-40-TYG-31 TaxID=3040276 RepID=UPI00254E5D94|nr:hypothetical protein [Agrobacterium sp. lyk4-40-TYG-31]
MTFNLDPSGPPPPVSPHHSAPPIPTPPVPKANRDACQRVREITYQLFVDIVDREMVRRDRRHAMAHIRQIALYISHVALSLPMWQVAICFGRDQSTASITCQNVEDRREDAGFDEFVLAVEEAVKPLIPTLEIAHDA